MQKVITVACIGIFALASVPLTASDSYADKRDRNGKYSREYRERDSSPRYERHINKREKRYIRNKRWRAKRHVISPRAARYGHVVKRLPRGFRRSWYNRRPYFYNRGVFYRPARYGYSVVRGPVGAIVVSLPVGYQRLWIDGSTYYSYGSTFYSRAPAGYAVVNPPAPAAAVVVNDETPEIVQPSRPATGEVIVNAPVLNVRAGPDMGENKIYQVDEGYILEVHGRSDGWLYVQIPNGEYGWVKAVFTKKLEAASG